MPRRKALKVIADVHLHATTCPGVFLPGQQDVYICVELFGQRKRTQSTSPVFPFLFHEKLRFDKVFSHCTDPVQIASALEGETLRVELVQLTYPEGELLATYEDNARDFLFPTPRVCPSYPGVDREVLLQRSSSFPGIAPKLEFSSRTVIKEVTSVNNGSHSARRKKDKHKVENDFDSYKSPCCATYAAHESVPAVKSSIPHSSNNRSSSSKKKTKLHSSSSPARGRTRNRAASLNRGSTKWGYEQPTIASLSRSPSPYTRRRMAQLSIKDPFDSAVKEKPFKTDLEERPNFVVRKAQTDGLSFNKDPPDLPRVSPHRRTTSASPTNRTYSPSKRKQTPGPPSRYRRRARDYDSDDRNDESADARLSFPCNRVHTLVGPLSAYDRYDNLKSAYYRPITPECCLARRTDSSNADLKLFMKDQDTKREVEYERPGGASFSKERRRISSARGKERDKGSRKLASRVSFKNTTELIESSVPYQRHSSPGRGQVSARSATESTPRPMTPRRDLSFSRADLDHEPVGWRASGLDGDGLHRKPLCERARTGEPSPYEKIRDRVRNLLTSPRANQIVDDSVAEANDRYWRRRSRSPSPRSTPRSTVSVPLGNGEYWSELTSDMVGRPHRRVFEESIDKIYDGIYHDMRRDNT